MAENIGTPEGDKATFPVGRAATGGDAAGTELSPGGVAAAGGTFTGILLVMRVIVGGLPSRCCGVEFEGDESAGDTPAAGPLKKCGGVAWPSDELAILTGATLFFPATEVETPTGDAAAVAGRGCKWL